METTEFIKLVEKTNKEQLDHSDFYELAEKYGFCTPWCECEKCSPNELVLI